MVLNIWKFRFLLKNLKLQKFNEILVKNLKTQNDFKTLTF